MVGGSLKVRRTNDTARAAALRKSAHAPPCQLEVGAKTAHMLNTVAWLANDTLIDNLHSWPPQPRHIRTIPWLINN